ncbi:MAG: hypothetical protein JW928_03595 [Candidatus Aureabacteria bacterium]|nr:hypothetical protein [Candidatus Auribacterota bacterium]
MKKNFFGLFASVTAVTGIVFFLCGECFCGNKVIIRSVQRVPRSQYILNEHDELIGTRYNQKFYAGEKEQKELTFIIRLSNDNLIPYAVHLFYKTAQSKTIQAKILEVNEPKKAKEILTIALSPEEIMSKGSPDFWWVEVRSASGDEVYDEAGVKNYKEIKKRIELIDQTGQS